MAQRLCTARDAASMPLSTALLERGPNKENTTLIWLDPGVGTGTDADKMVERLRQINDYVLLYQDRDECRMGMERIQNERILLVTCGPQASKIVSHVTSLAQVEAVFIFCENRSQCASLLRRCGKIVDIFVDFDVLRTAIQERVYEVNKQMEISDFFTGREKSFKDLVEETVDFRWFQLFTQVILSLPRDHQAKSQMVSTCRLYYQGNSSELKLIDAFEKRYEKDHALKWYSEESFAYKLVNRAFRREDIDLLYAFRLFIGDLSDSIAMEYRIIQASEKRVWTVYRGAQLSIEQLDKLKESEGRHHSLNGFISTSQSEEVALNFALHNAQRDDLAAIVFEITCEVDAVGDQVRFADIPHHSAHSHEQEVLFDMNSTFFVRTVRCHPTMHPKTLQTVPVWWVYMSTSAGGQSITHPYIEETHRQVKEMGARIVFGRLMCNKGCYEQALKYFQQLLKEPGNDDLAWIEFNIGRSYRFQGNFEEARKYYDLAYNRMMNSQRKRIKDSARVIRNIGKVLRDQGQGQEALQFYRRALEIQETFLDLQHPDIANSLGSIGSILDDQGDYDQALGYFQRALGIQKSCLPENHPDIASILSHTGTALQNKGELSEALDSYQRAFGICEKVLPPDHPDIASSMINIGSILRKQGKVTVAREYYQAALEIQKKNLPPKHWLLARSLTGLGSILEYRKQHDEALDYYHQALSILETSFPPNHPHIASSCMYIGTILYDQEKNDEALEYFHRALQIRERSLVVNHHLIGDSCFSKASCLEDLNKPKIALKYYRSALAVYEHCLSLRLTSHEQVKKSIRRLSNKK